MKEKGLTPNGISYNSAVDACGKAGKPDSAVNLLREMTAKGLTPNEISYNSAIEACRKAGKTEVALLLLRRMREGLNPE